MRAPLRAAVVVGGIAAAAGCGAGPGSRPPVAALTALESPAVPGSGEPNLAVGPDGTLYLSWLEPTADGGHALRLAARRDTAWSEPVTVASGADFFVNWADFPSVIALPDGSLAAHWLVRTGGGAAYDIHVARSRDGGATWAPAVVPHRDGTVSEHGFVSMLAGADGRLTVVWLDGRKYAETAASDHDPSAEMTVRLTTIGLDGALGPERLLDGRTCDCCQTAAAMTDAGPVVVYRDRSADEVRDIAIVRSVDGRWTEPRPVHEDGWVIRACPVNGPAIAAAGRDVVVAWFTAANDSPRVRVAFSEDAGATFGAPLDVGAATPVGRVDVERLDDGTALVSWIERTADAAEIRVRRIGAAGPIGPPHTVAASSAARASGFPRMARVGDEVVFAWTEPGRPSQVRVAAARLEGGST
ncbi:MAG TPA: sialidase family protein [Longimicrobiales bacterium]